MHLFRHGAQTLECPAFARPFAGVPAAFMALYNRRMAAIARSRQRRGAWGSRNFRRFYAFPGYDLNKVILLKLLGAVWTWLCLEIREGWRTPFNRPEQPIPARTPAQAVIGST
jgi:hypothetical protein